MLVAFRADSGSWLARCNGCQRNVQNVKNTDSITVHATAATRYAVFKVVDIGPGSLGLMTDNGKYVALAGGWLRYDLGQVDSRIAVPGVRCIL